jgi:hypothetical protein
MEINACLGRSQLSYHVAADRDLWFRCYIHTDVTTVLGSQRLGTLLRSELISRCVYCQILLTKWNLSGTISATVCDCVSILPIQSPTALRPATVCESSPLAYFRRQCCECLRFTNTHRDLVFIQIVTLWPTWYDNCDLLRHEWKSGLTFSFVAF